MPETDKWLDEYGKRHTDIGFPGIYWPAVALLVLSTVGMLWSLPVPAEFTRISPVLNWGSAFLMAAVVYYFIISLPLAFGMMPFVFAVAGAQVWLSNRGINAAPLASGLFVVSIIGLVAGHQARAGFSAVFNDIQMMMIAPVWLLSRLYRRLGIPF